MDIKSICIICDGYPTKFNETNTFVKQLVIALADVDIFCTVIAPYSITSALVNRKKAGANFEVEKTSNGKDINIYRPRYFSFSSKNIFGINTFKLTNFFFSRIVKKQFKKINTRFDAIHAHFLLPSGLAAASIDKSIPVFYANGESKLQAHKTYKLRKVQAIMERFSGIISVSSFNKQELIDLKLAGNDKIIVLPNGINSNTFYKRDKNGIRKELGINQNDFVVAFVGHFNERKGSERLSRALECLPDVKSIFIGDGAKVPTCENQLFCGKLSHNDLPKYLNAADIFVLPTKAEGCCNAIIEAMACGLPIISSDKPFNDDILNNKNSIRLDVEDVGAIKQAIIKLKEDVELRQNMSNNAILTASEFNIQTRAHSIIKFMSSKM